MWFPTTLRAKRPQKSAPSRRASLAGYGLFFPLFLVPALLSGCGGGGSGGVNSISTSDQGFRIVPAGGDVIPNFSDDGTPAGVTLVADPNAVAEGARVDLFHHTLTPEESAALTNQVGKLVGPLAYSLVLTPNLSTFGGQVQMKVTVNAKLADAAAVPGTIKIYTYNTAAKGWVVLPGTFTGTTDPNTGVTSGSVTGRMVFFSGGQSQGKMIDSGIYVVAYDVGPALPTGI